MTHMIFMTSIVCHVLIAYVLAIAYLYATEGLSFKLNSVLLADMGCDC